ncbi:MAG TPA: hypothetical protein VFF67_09655 [Thermoplasmata archaeon]|nr:hypothetical protein [Thermoplasmata archaeon]
MIAFAFLSWLSWAGAVRSPFLRARPTRHLPHQDPISLVHSAIAAPRLSEIARFLLRDLTFELHAALHVGWAELPSWARFRRRWAGVPVGRLRATRFRLRALIRDLMLEERERDVAVIDGVPPPTLDGRLAGRLEATIPTVRALVDELRGIQSGAAAASPDEAGARYSLGSAAARGE